MTGFNIKVGETKRIESRLSASRVNNAWIRLNYVSPVGRERTFNLRPNQVKSIINKERGTYETIAENIYSEWIRSSKAGRMYADRNHVEGILKTARERGDERLVKEIENVLTKSDKKVSEYWNKWYDDHTAAYIEDFFDYEPEGMDASGLKEGEYEG